MTPALDKPTILSDHAQALIVETLAGGAFLSVACRSAGVPYRTFRRWQRRWEQGDPAATRFAEFFHEVDRASAESECNALEVIQAGGPDWLRAAWYLSRRHPQRWGRKARTTAEDPR